MQAESQSRALSKIHYSLLCLLPVNPGGSLSWINIAYGDCKSY